MSNQPSIETLNQIVTPDSIVQGILDHQRTLMVRYDEIEEAAGFIVPHSPWDLDNKFVQARIKELMFRAVEEVAEAEDALVSVLESRPGNMLWNAKWQDTFDSNELERAFLEEISDVMHFVAEATILAGVPVEKITELSHFWSDDTPQGVHTLSASSCDIASAMYQIPIILGGAARFLKNKPWKQTHRATDTDSFFSEMAKVWCGMGKIFDLLNITRSTAFRLYTLKFHINQQRQESGY